MSQLTLTTISNGDTPDASVLMTNLNTLKNRINLGMESDNIAANAVDGSHINLGAYIFKQSKGADVASAGTTTLGNDGNYFDITGTTTITSITAKTAGTVVQLQFDGILTVTDGSNLKLAGNMTTAAESTLTLVSDGTNWFEVSRSPNGYTPTAANALAGSVIQVASTQTGAVATGSTALPNDDTIPQITEGDQYLSLAITPTSATNKLLIQAVVCYSPSAAASAGVCLFQDATANALAAEHVYLTGTNVSYTTSLNHFMTSGTTSPTTFRIRIGLDAGTLTFNGFGGARKFGGVIASSLTILEIKV